MRLESGSWISAFLPGSGRPAAGAETAEILRARVRIHERLMAPATELMGLRAALTHTTVLTGIPVPRPTETDPPQRGSQPFLSSARNQKRIRSVVSRTGNNWDSLGNKIFQEIRVSIVYGKSADTLKKHGFQKVGTEVRQMYGFSAKRYRDFRDKLYKVASGMCHFHLLSSWFDSLCFSVFIPFSFHHSTFPIQIQLKICVCGENTISER